MLFLFQYIRNRKVFFAHDPLSECVEGDIVMIQSCYPISKKKHFTVEEILERAPRYTPQVESAPPTPTK